MPPARLLVSVTAEFHSLTSEQALLFLSNWLRQLTPYTDLVPHPGSSLVESTPVPGDPGAHVRLKFQTR